MFAVRAHPGRVPVTIIQAQLGHAHLPTTSVNLNHLGPQDVIAAGRRPTDPGLTCSFEVFASGRQPETIEADGAEATGGESVTYVTSWGVSVNGSPETIEVPAVTLALESAEGIARVKVLHDHVSTEYNVTQHDAAHD